MTPVHGGRPCPLALFLDDEGGYTTVAVAVALLVSVTLVFASAAVTWTSARSADVQVVADASAMAGANAVAAYTTVAQVLDACVLTMGLAGMLVYGVGLVVAAIPLLQEGAPAILDAGRHILDARRSFARTAMEGLSRLERALPALVTLNSASCVSASCTDGIEYFGCAIPFPQESESDFSSLDDGLDHDELDRQAERLREASAKRADALERANAAKERAWRADCVDDPSCLRSRAAVLAGLGGASNPSYPLVADWRFGYALTRARNYYLMRLRNETPAGDSIEERVRSAARRAFYRYARTSLLDATCVEQAERVKIDLPSLPHNKDELRPTTLYTEAQWPCTSDGVLTTLHGYASCPAALVGVAAGSGSLAELEAGRLHECPSCHMNVGAMASVASASTNIDNGFEHYWRIVVEASRVYQAACQEASAAEEELRSVAAEGASAFQRALDALSVPRPKLRPPGAWGCVSVVVRKSGSIVPSELTSAFLAHAALPPGAAMSAATLAPDEGTTETNNVLARVFDGVRGEGGVAISLVGSLTELWGRLLIGYGSLSEGAGRVASTLFDGIGTIFGERVASWLRDRLMDIIDGAGLRPADLRLRKPVLVASQSVLDKVGATSLAKAREIVAQLPADLRAMSASTWAKIAAELGYGQVTVAELPVPGTDITIPLTIDLERLAEAL